LHGNGLTTVGANLAHYLVGRQGVAGVVDRYGVATLGRQQGGGCAYSARAAGDQKARVQEDSS
jgi:hypothetical protein